MAGSGEVKAGVEKARIARAAGLVSAMTLVSRVLGLVRALQVAGARSVVASLWRVDDESTAELMGRFYSALATGLPRDEALRQAQLELLRGEVEVERDGRKVALRTSEPRHWAPFILIGPAD